MRTITKTRAEVDGLQFGYWDVDTEQFVPVDAQCAGELEQAVAKLGATPELLDALAMLVANIKELVGYDLRTIWKRLNELA